MLGQSIEMERSEKNWMLLQVKSLQSVWHKKCMRDKKSSRIGYKKKSAMIKKQNLRGLSETLMPCLK